MVANEYRQKNVPAEYLKAKDDAKKSGEIVEELDDLDWAYFFFMIPCFVQ